MDAVNRFELIYAGIDNIMSAYINSFQHRAFIVLQNFRYCSV